jgi:hypothetical protein
MGKMHEAFSKTGGQRQSENSQASAPEATVQHWHSWPSQKVFNARFALGVCLGLAVCNLFVLLLLLFRTFVLKGP